MDPASARFVLRALALKDAPRRGWLRVGVARPESVADHSWGVGLLALLSAPEGLDRARVLELALLHDVSEAVTGDLVPGEYASKEEKLALERRALDGMLEGCAEGLRRRMLAAFDELARGETPEARFVHGLDKAEMAFQARRYADAGVPVEALRSYRESAARGVGPGGMAGTLRWLEGEG